MKQFKFFQIRSVDEEYPLLSYFDLLFPYYHARHVVFGRPNRLSEGLVSQIYIQIRNSILNGDVSTYNEIRHLLTERFYQHTNHHFRVSEDIHNNLVSGI